MLHPREMKELNFPLYAGGGNGDSDRPGPGMAIEKPSGAGFGKQNVRDREHFGGGPVSKTIERAGHSVSNQCSVSRALRGSTGSRRQFPAVGEGVAAIHGWALYPAQIWRMPDVHGLR